MVWADDAERATTAPPRRERDRRYLASRRRGRAAPVLASRASSPPRSAASSPRSCSPPSAARSARLTASSCTSTRATGPARARRRPDAGARAAGNGHARAHPARRPIAGLVRHRRVGRAGRRRRRGAHELASQRTEYEAYHTRHASPGERPLDDWAKVVLVPGLGMITASRDKRGAITASVCYRAVIEAIANAELIEHSDSWPSGTYSSSSIGRWSGARSTSRIRASAPHSLCRAMSRWSSAAEAASKGLRPALREGGRARRGGGSRWAGGRGVAAEICLTNKDRAIGVALDVRDDASLAELVQRTVLTFGGIDSLFYTAGQAPRFARVTAFAARSAAAAGRALRGRRARDGRRCVGNAPAGARRVDRRVGVEGGARAGARCRRHTAAARRRCCRRCASPPWSWAGDGIRVNAINADQVGRRRSSCGSYANAPRCAA